MSRGMVLGGFAVLLLAGADSGGCSGDREVAVRLLGGGGQCGGSGSAPSVRRLTTVEELAAALSPGLGAAPSVPSVDLATEVVVLVAAGQKPTAGFGVHLAATRAPVKEGAAGLKVAFASPPEGAMVAQVTTSPCLVVALPREGLRAVAALDGGKVVGTARLE